MNILIVDDEPLICKGIQKMIDLKEENHTVKLTQSSLEAVELSKHDDFDLLISDIQMPNLNGLELTREIKKIQPIETIFISGYNDFDYLKQAIELKSSNYILKPIDINELWRTIDDVKLQYKISSASIRYSSQLREEFQIEDLITQKFGQLKFSDYRVASIYLKKLDNLFLNSFIMFLDLNDIIYKFSIITKDEILIFFKDTNDNIIQDKIINYLRYSSSFLYFYPKILDIKLFIEFYQSNKAFIQSNPLTEFTYLDFSYLRLTAIDLLSAQKKLPPQNILQKFLQLIYFRKHLDYKLLISSFNRLNKSESFDLINLDLFNAKKKNPLIQKLLDTSKENISEHYTLKELADSINMNAAYLGQLIQKELNCSYNNYMQKFRMAEANKRIHLKNMRISEIAHSLGYDDISLFYRHYKKEFGITPNQEKKQS